ncbi:Mitogen-activated protein kinase kinase kinase 7 [Balamuthia mandrillaris]
MRREELTESIALLTLYGALALATLVLLLVYRWRKQQLFRPSFTWRELFLISFFLAQLCQLVFWVVGLYLGETSLDKLDALPVLLISSVHSLLLVAFMKKFVSLRSDLRYWRVIAVTLVTCNLLCYLSFIFAVVYKWPELEEEVLRLIQAAFRGITYVVLGATCLLFMLLCNRQERIGRRPSRLANGMLVMATFCYFGRFLLECLFSFWLKKEPDLGRVYLEGLSPGPFPYIGLFLFYFLGDILPGFCLLLVYCELWNVPVFCCCGGGSLHSFHVINVPGTSRSSHRGGRGGRPHRWEGRKRSSTGALLCSEAPLEDDYLGVIEFAEESGSGFLSNKKFVAPDSNYDEEGGRGFVFERNYGASDVLSEEDAPPLLILGSAPNNQPVHPPSSQQRGRRPTLQKGDTQNAQLPQAAEREDSAVTRRRALSRSRLKELSTQPWQNAGLKRISEEELTLHQPIGSGGYGKVFQAQWKEKGPVAIKKFHFFPEERNPERARFEIEVGREIFVLTEVRHPNIVQLHGITTLDGSPALVMELMETNLWDLLHRRKPQGFTLQLRIAVAREIAKAMRVLEENEIIHRDLKPHNVLLSNYEEAFRKGQVPPVKLCDFGLSRDVATKMTIGPTTARYNAPEVLRHGAYSKKADVYSYGVVLWELLTNDIPWKEHRYVFPITQLVDSGQRPPIPPFCPDFIRKLITACWLSEPSLRPSFRRICMKLAQFFGENEEEGGSSSSSTPSCSEYVEQLGPLEEERLEWMFQKELREQEQEREQQEAKKNNGGGGRRRSGPDAVAAALNNNNAPLRLNLSQQQQTEEQQHAYQQGEGEEEGEEEEGSGEQQPLIGSLGGAAPSFSDYDEINSGGGGSISSSSTSGGRRRPPH